MKRDYSLTGSETILAIQAGLAEADWYRSPVPRDKMRELLIRRDGPAVRDTLIWFGLIFGSGYLVFLLWGSWLAIFPYMVYSVLYASTSDSRWHESGHGTAFKTDWMNNLLYEISSFMVFRQSTVWRWSHTRHHSDTIIRGRDPEIAVPRPPDLKKIILSFFGISGAVPELKRLVSHAAGTIDSQAATYVPEQEYGKVFLRARIYSANIFVCDSPVSHFRLNPSPDVHRIAHSARYLAYAGVRAYTACRPAGKCSRSQAKLQDSIYEPIAQVPLLEHELSCGAPYVSPGSIPCPAKAS